MKKRWLLSLLAVTGGSVYALSKFIKKEKEEEDVQRKAMTAYYEQLGYNVHMYNDNNDFMLFHHEKNEKRHVFYIHDSVDEEMLHSKLKAYYFHFTNEFFFVCQNDEVVERTKALYHQWHASLEGDIIERYGEVTSYFTTVDELIG